MSEERITVTLSIPRALLEVDSRVIPEVDPYGTGDSPTVYDVQINEVELSPAFDGFDLKILDFEDDDLQRVLVDEFRAA